jgi:hypothetical protein
MLATSIFVTLDTPLARWFDFESFEARHGGYRLEFGIWLACWTLGKTLYLYFFRRTQIAAEKAAFRSALAQGRVKRMSFTSRWVLIFCLLGIVSIGWAAPQPHRTHILTLAIPLFLLLCAAELNVIIHPGESLMPNPADELLTFFKARMLQAGYITAIAALTVLYLIYLVAPSYIGLILPVVLAACLLVPSLVYNGLDRRAAADG